MILPATLSDIGSMISLAMNVIRRQGTGSGTSQGQEVKLDGS
jgi:hypothetical protein